MFASYCLIVYFCIFVEIFAQTNYTTTTLGKKNLEYVLIICIDNLISIYF